MKNVGIITFHCSYNYGSALQSYALQTCVEMLGYKVSIIDFVLKGDFEQYRLFRTKFYRNHVKSLGADLLYFVPHLKRKTAFEKFRKNRLHMTAKRYYDSKEMYELNAVIDIFICGSDQIWNLDCTHGIEDAFFLKFADYNKIKIAYAPSLAHTEFKYENKQELQKLINRLDAVSVREESTIFYLQPLTDKKITVALDPVLLLNRADYQKLIQKIPYRKKYIFIYMLEKNKELIKYCTKIQKETGYKILYISNKVNCGIKRGKNLFGISPEQFLGYIDSAEYIITNSFHATVFSIIFNKKFCTFPTVKSSARMVDLLNKLNLQTRIYGENFDMDRAIDYGMTISKLDELKKNSLKFLKDTLCGEKID